MSDGAFTYEPDLRHAELIVQELGLEGAKAVITSWVETNYGSDAKCLLNDEYNTKYQSLSARLNFLALDIQFPAKECARKLSAPTVEDWDRLKRVGRCVLGKHRCIINCIRFAQPADPI